MDAIWLRMSHKFWTVTLGREFPLHATDIVQAIKAAYNAMSPNARPATIVFENSHGANPQLFETLEHEGLPVSYQTPQSQSR